MQHGMLGMSTPSMSANSRFLCEAIVFGRPVSLATARGRGTLVVCVAGTEPAVLCT